MKVSHIRRYTNVLRERCSKNVRKDAIAIDERVTIDTFMQALIFVAFVKMCEQQKDMKTSLHPESHRNFSQMQFTLL